MIVSSRMVSGEPGPAELRRIGALVDDGSLHFFGALMSNGLLELRKSALPICSERIRDASTSTST
jgi:hypothetical protein